MAYEDLGPKEFLTAYKAAGDNAVLLDVRTPQEIEEMKKMNPASAEEREDEKFLKGH